MRVRKIGLYSAAALITILGSYQALSDSSEMTASYDTAAFNEAWTGDYYVEPEASQGQFNSFEAKKRFYLESPSVGRDEVEVDENGNPLPQIAGSKGHPESELSEPFPGPSGVPPLFPLRVTPAPSFIPFFGFGSKPLPLPSASPIPAAVDVPVETPSEKPTDIPGVVTPKLSSQAFYYYNRGSLQNASDLGSDGRGYVKVFRDRDEKIGGRSWGTRSLVNFIKKIASDFSEKYPGRERIQIADLSRKSGGMIGHASHQNGLDADIVYIRSDKKEQLAFGGYGKNGFAEQFVVPGAVTYRAYRDTKGRTRKVKSVALKTSTNFDVPANFDLMLLMQKSGLVKDFFIDKILIREFFRHAETKNLIEDVDVKSMLAKFDHAANHADHVHVRLYCQDSDSKCVSDVAAPVRRSSKKKAPTKKPSTTAKPKPKAVMAAKTPAKAI